MAIGDAKETAYDYIQGEDHGTFYTGQEKWINKINKWKEQYPDQIDIIHINEDNSILVHLPSSWFKLNPPHTKQLTDEQRQKLSERMKSIGKNNKSNT